jgi:aspartokinase-like uncharacterized kinase
MEAVLKIGGSLAENPDSLFRLCEKLGDLAKGNRIVVVPGGGEFADIVRELDKRIGLSNRIAHQMAVLAMDQYGLLLSDIIPNSSVVSEIEKLNSSAEGKLQIVLPSKYIFIEDPLENSWNVTSDTIAAQLSERIHAKKLILVTNVDGIFSENPKQKPNAQLIKELSAKQLLTWKKRTSVDVILPKIILQTGLDCYVVNGKHPERIEQILKNIETVCTRITHLRVQ